MRNILDIQDKYDKYLLENERIAFIRKLQKDGGLTVKELKLLSEREPDKKVLDFIDSIIDKKTLLHSIGDKLNVDTLKKMGFNEPNMYRIKTYDGIAAKLGAVLKRTTGYDDSDYKATAYFDLEGKEVYHTIKDFIGYDWYYGTPCKQRVWGKELLDTSNNSTYSIIYDDKIILNAVGYAIKPEDPARTYEIELNLKTGEFGFFDPEIRRIEDTEELIFYVSNPSRKRSNFSFPVTLEKNSTSISTSSLETVRESLDWYPTDNTISPAKEMSEDGVVIKTGESLKI